MSAFLARGPKIFPGHFKTGIFGYRFTDSSSIVNMVEESEVKPEKVDEVVAQYGVEKVNRC